MRSIFGLSLSILTLTTCAAFSPIAHAQNPSNNPYFYSNQTYSYGFFLPQVPLPNGQDEIRAADGTTCRSSMASNNAYLDVGGLGNQGASGDIEGGTLYGRIVVPLGERPKRLNCAHLYDLEISRLRHELELMRSGVAAAGLGSNQNLSSADPSAPPGNRYIAGAPAPTAGGNWATDGWSRDGATVVTKPEATPQGVQVPTSGSQSTQQSTPQATPQTTPQAVPQSAPQTAPQAVPQTDTRALPQRDAPRQVHAPAVEHDWFDEQTVRRAAVPGTTDFPLPSRRQPSRDDQPHQSRLARVDGPARSAAPEAVAGSVAVADETVISAERTVVEIADYAAGFKAAVAKSERPSPLNDPLSVEESRARARMLASNPTIWNWAFDAGFEVASADIDGHN